MKKLITLLESLTNKKVVLEDSVFKSRKLEERLLPIKKELEKHMTIDENKKIIIVNKDISYNDCLVLEKFYQGYVIDVNGFVDLNFQNLKQLPSILFNKISGYFCCSFNQLISLEHCPEKINGSFSCSHNHLISLEYCPKVVGSCFNCDKNSSRFTKEDVLKRCKVKSDIYC
jgi:hypothetical protein